MPGFSRVHVRLGDSIPRHVEGQHDLFESPVAASSGVHLLLYLAAKGYDVAFALYMTRSLYNIVPRNLFCRILYVYVEPAARSYIDDEPPCVFARSKSEHELYCCRRRLRCRLAIGQHSHSDLFKEFGYHVSLRAERGEGEGSGSFNVRSKAHYQPPELSHRHLPTTHFIPSTL